MYFSTLGALWNRLRCEANRRALAADVLGALTGELRASASRLGIVETLEGRKLLAASINGITLFNADTDKPIGGTLSNNATVSVDLKSGRHITFRAEANAASVRFGYDGQPNYKLENTAPFMFASDNGADYYGFTPSVGTHTVTATAFDGKGASGAASSTIKITVKVTDSGGSTPTPTPTPTPPTSSGVKWPSGWQSGPSAPSPRFESAGHVLGGKIYSFGGFKDSRFNVDRTYVSFDPNTNQWTKLGALPVGMAETHMGVADDGHYIYFVGGFGGNFRHGSTPVQIASDKVWRYEPSTNHWTQLKSLPTARGAGGASVINGKLHYFGGNPKDRVTNLKDHIVLDLSNQSAGWKLRAPMPIAKDHFSTITIGSKIYALGGEKGHDKLANIQRSVHVYDDTNDSWKQLADMPLTNSHSEGGTFVLDGQIVFAGGQYNHAQNSTNRVVAYNPATNAWKELKPLPVYRQGAIVGVFGNKVVLTLGAEKTSQPKSTTWIGYR